MTTRWAKGSLDRRKFIRLYRGFVPIAMMASVFEITESTICKQARKFGLPLRGIPQPKPKLVSETFKRRCLMCDKGFPSEGIHNHVCKRCKGTEQWKTGRVALG